MIIYGKMNRLILDIKVEIASKNDQVWYYMYRYDKVFRKYALSNIGKKRYIELFIEYAITTDSVEYYLFGKLHSIYDQPAIIDAGSKYWYYNGMLHRDNDQPAIIFKDGTQYWYCYDKLHR